MKRLFSIIAILFLCLPALAFAEPSISDVSGTISEDETITISGSAFGTKSTAAPVKWDDFEDGADETALKDTDSSWSAYSGDGALYTDTDSHSGSLSVYNDASGGGSDFATNQISISTTEKLFVSFWLKVETDGDWGSCVYKLVRLGSDNDGDSIYHNAGWKLSDTPYLFYDDGADSTYLDDLDVPLNEWVHIQMYEELSTIGESNGTAIGEAVGHDLHEYTSQNTRSTDFTLNGVFMGLAADSCDDVSLVLRADDFYIDNTRARVEMGNASTFSSCTHREIQIPSAWSSDSIAVTVNTGSFSTDDTAYLYVVDEDGAVNSSGYEVTVDSTSEDITAPTLSGNPTIESDGTTVSIATSKTTMWTGYTSGDMDLDCTTAGNDIVLSSPTGSGTDWDLTAASTINDGDTCTLDFNGATDSVEDSAGNDMEAITDQAVTNNSIQGSESPVGTIGVGSGSGNFNVGDGSGSIRISQ